MKSMPEISKADEGGGVYLGKDVVIDNAIKTVTIQEEFDFVESEYEGKKRSRLQGKVKTDVDEPSECIWKMNLATQNYMIDKFGSNTATWVGKTVEISIKKAGNMKASVYPKDLSLEKTIES